MKKPTIGISSVAASFSLSIIQFTAASILKLPGKV